MNPLPSVESAIVANLPYPLVIEIAGADATKVINNLTTNDVQRLAVDRCAESFVTDLRGWVVAHGLVIKQPERILLWGSHPVTNQVTAHVDRYIIREDARVSDLSCERSILLLDAPPQSAIWQTLHAGGWETNMQEFQLGEVSVMAARLPITGPNCWGLCCEASQQATLQQVLLDAGARLACNEELELRRIANFWPMTPADIREKTIPQELARDPQAISFTKGCYLGQETIARLDARGQLQKKLCLVSIAGDELLAIGTAIHAGEKEVGQLTSVAADRSGQQLLCLAFLRRGNFEPGTQLSCGGRQTTVLPVASD